MVLVEREGALAALEQVVDGLRGGAGRLVLLGGEAGSGKTSLIRSFVASLRSDVDCVIGACDGLRTARPVAPLLDWANEREPGLAGAMAAMPRDELFDAALRLFTGGLTVAVVEDAHWADEATMDVLKFLARRLDAIATVLVVTYRSDEVVAGHPLFATLGELVSVAPVRVPVMPLSPDGVSRLAAGVEVDPVELHRRTGGNAFFVTECVSAGGGTVPTTVSQAVLARAAGLSPAARVALDAVAVVPGRTELWMAAALGASGPGIDECVARGVLVADSTFVWFRHELAREAVQQVLLPHSRGVLHRRAVGALLSPPSGEVDHARIVHHAVGSGDGDTVAAHAPLAAQAAAIAGARREAIAHLELAISYAGRLSTMSSLELWARLAAQRALIGRHDDAIAAYEEALSLAGVVGDDERRGSLLAEMWSPLSMAGRLDRAGRAATEATELLERHRPSTGLALAYAQRCSTHMLARELPDAEPWGRAAIELSEQLGDQEVLAYALIQSGVALWMAGMPEGLGRVRRGVGIAKSERMIGLVAQGLSQIGSGGGEVRQYPVAVAALQECVDFAERHELGSRGLYALAWLARCQLELGQWDEASTLLASVLRSPLCEGITRMTALTAIGRLRTRRGDPDVWPALDEALALARETGHLQRLWPIAAARAEAAWLDDRLNSELDLVQDICKLAARLDYPWAVGELGFWLWRGGQLETVSGADPFALHAAGHSAASAAAWASLGCVYEQATALADGTDDDQRAALALFDHLGAAPALRRLIERRRMAGLTVPRGPNAVTRANVAGLTDRELDVLRLVATGHTNPEIGAALHITAKTAGHHVSHLLTKLGARSRAEAVATAIELGVTVNREPTPEK